MSETLIGQAAEPDAQAAAAAASAEDTSGNQGHQSTDWRSALPEELRSDKVFESIKGKDAAEALPTLAKNYAAAQKMIGADKLVLPNDKSSPEEIAEFNKKIGVPDEAKDYTFKLPEGVKPEQLDNERIEHWKGKLHEVGIPANKADAIITEYIAKEFEANQAADKARSDGIDANELTVKQEFGDKFDEKVNYARFALKEYGDDEASAALEQSGLGSHPAILRLLAKVGETMSDDPNRGGRGPPQMGSISPENAQAELNAFNANGLKQEALFDAQHAQHDTVVAERTALFEAAFPPERPVG